MCFQFFGVRKMGLRTALLSGTVFCLRQKTKNINALPDSVNVVPDMFLFWSLYWCMATTWSLLHAPCVLTWCCRTIKPCVPAPPFSSLSAKCCWCRMPGKKGESTPNVLLAVLQDTSQAPQFAVQRPMLRVGMSVMVFCDFFCPATFYGVV